MFQLEQISQVASYHKIVFIFVSNLMSQLGTKPLHLYSKYKEILRDVSRDIQVGLRTFESDTSYLILKSRWIFLCTLYFGEGVLFHRGISCAFLYFIWDAVFDVMLHNWVLSCILIMIWNINNRNVGKVSFDVICCIHEVFKCLFATYISICSWYLCPRFNNEYKKTYSGWVGFDYCDRYARLYINGYCRRKPTEIATDMK